MGGGDLQRAEESSPLVLLDEEICWWSEQEKVRALKLLDLARVCTRVSFEARPSMREVIKSLYRINDLRKPTE